MRRLHQIHEHLASSESELIASIFNKGLYTINAINKAVNRDILSMAYSPGVGAACM